MPNKPTSDIWHLVQELLDKIKSLTKENSFLQGEVSELRSGLQQYDHAKTSLNSSLPPSKDTLPCKARKRLRNNYKLRFMPCKMKK